MKTKSSGSVSKSVFSMLVGVFARSVSMVSIALCIGVVQLSAISAVGADAGTKNAEKIDAEKANPEVVPQEEPDVAGHNFGDNDPNQPLIDYCRLHDGIYKVDEVSEINRKEDKIMVSILLVPSPLNANGNPLKPIYMFEDISKLSEIVATDFIIVRTFEIRKVCPKGTPIFSTVEVNVFGYKNACRIYTSVERFVHPVGCSAKDYFKDADSQSKPKKEPAGSIPKPEPEKNPNKSPNKDPNKKKKPVTVYEEPKVT